MNDALRMQVSAFVDGELADNETELLLRRLSQDAALRQLVSQYLAIGRAVRNEREVPGVGDLRGRIAAALGEEQPVESAPVAAGTPSRWLCAVPEASLADRVAEAGYTEPDLSEALPARPASETLRQYYVRHGETSSDLGPNGILTRLVTLELRRGELVEIEPGGTRVTPVDTPVTDPDASDGTDVATEPEQTP
jgi:sigma-E factor negative regulatory protein RseA